MFIIKLIVKSNKLIVNGKCEKCEKVGGIGIFRQKKGRMVGLKGKNEWESGI